MRISVWSADVCSSDLQVSSTNCAGPVADARGFLAAASPPDSSPTVRPTDARATASAWVSAPAASAPGSAPAATGRPHSLLGRHAWRERVCPYVSLHVGAVSFNKKNI